MLAWYASVTPLPNGYGGSVWFDAVMQWPVFRAFSESLAWLYVAQGRQGCYVRRLKANTKYFSASVAGWPHHAILQLASNVESRLTLPIVCGA